MIINHDYKPITLPTNPRTLLTGGVSCFSSLSGFLSWLWLTFFQAEFDAESEAEMEEQLEDGALFVPERGTQERDCEREKRLLHL